MAAKKAALRIWRLILLQPKQKKNIIQKIDKQTIRYTLFANFRIGAVIL